MDYIVIVDGAWKAVGPLVGTMVGAWFTRRRAPDAFERQTSATTDHLRETYVEWLLGVEGSRVPIEPADKLALNRCNQRVKLLDWDDATARLRKAVWDAVPDDPSGNEVVAVINAIGCWQPFEDAKEALLTHQRTRLAAR